MDNRRNAASTAAAIAFVAKSPELNNLSLSSTGSKPKLLMYLVGISTEELTISRHNIQANKSVRNDKTIALLWF